MSSTPNLPGFGLQDGEVYCVSALHRKLRLVPFIFLNGWMFSFGSQGSLWEQVL